MANLVRAFDWSKTALGTMNLWSEAFLGLVNLVLCSPVPLSLYCGPESLLIYNDGFRPFTHLQHPGSLGSPASKVWPEAWHILEPQVHAALATGQSTYVENLLIPLLIDGRMQDLYWTYSLSPAYENGKIVGVFNVCQSTTHSLLAERELRQSESRAQSVLQSIGDAVIVKDVNGRITRMNPVAEELTGWKMEDTPGHLLGEVFHIVDEGPHEPVENPADKVKRLGTVVSFNHNTILIRRDGREMHIDGTGGPIRSDEGELIGTVLVFRNIEERRQMEREVARVAARDHEITMMQDLLLKLLQGQRDTTNTAAMMLAAAEAVGRYLEVDRAGFFDVVDDSISRLTVCWTAGKLPLLSGDISLSVIGEGYLEEARAGKVRGVSDYETDSLTRNSGFGAIGVRSGIGVPILRHGKWQNGFYVHCSKVRVWTDAEVSFVREVANQTLDGVELATAQQALRRSEARARNILESIGDGVIVTDSNRMISGMNRVAEKLTGWLEAESLGQALANIFRLVSEESGDGIERAVALTGQTGTMAGIAGHAMLVRPDGVRLHIEHNQSPMREDDGRISGMVLTFRDTTDRNTTERRLRQAYKMEALGQLTGGIAHDFNNILAIIMGNLELIAESTASDPVTHERIEQTVASAERAADLTRRLLAYARQQPLDPTVLDVVNLIHAAAEFVRRSLGPTIALEVTVAPELWSARIDRNQFENALLNLAVNARDAMPGGGQLTIDCQNVVIGKDCSASNEMTPGEYLLISVSDTGTGMSGEALARATEPFFTTKAIGKGTGLGLSMVYGFLKQSEGHMQIESELNVGTKVMLYLPRAISVERQPATARTRPLPEPLPRGEELVLIVEDELAIRRTIGYLLHSLGYRVLEAEDGPAAMVYLKAAPRIDLLLTDVILPNGMSGPGLANEARVLQPAMKVIFSSGYTSNVLTRDYNLEEGVHLLNKPFHLAELAKMVRSVLDLAQ